MAVPAEHVRKLREMTGAPMMECKKALEEANGDPELAFTILRKRGQASAAKKAGRTAAEGLVGYYIHPGSKIGVIVEVNCETDFVARTDEFQQLAHDLAMQICAAAPRFIRKEDVTPDVLEQERAILRDQAASSGKPPEKLDQIVEGKLRKFFEENCLYEQHFIKDPAGTLTVRELITSKIAKFGENITVRRYSRFKVGEGIGKAASESAPPGEVAQ
ncbi:MAG: translation elongation factor Ts [Acidobacteria bacterium]|nr:MAG: translation elongation factor Ts [Acidobacteriota bacterium]